MIFSHAIIITHFENTVPGTAFSHARNTCCLFLTQVFRKRQNDIFASDNYHTFREYGPRDRILETMTLDLACEKYLLSLFNLSF